MFKRTQPLEVKEILLRAVAKRKGLEGVTNAMRLVNGKGDELTGITVDRYNQHFVIQLFNKQSAPLVKELAALIKEHFAPAYLSIKNRTSAAGHSLYNPQVNVLCGEAPKTIVEENGLKFAVNLNDAVNPGLFVDMRHNRQLISSLCRDKEVLNCFAYTCSFGVYARRGGATRVVNTDISEKILKKGQDNYHLNQIVPTKMEFMPVESVHYLERAVKKNNFFDVIFLDPPSFSRHDNKIFVAKRDLPQLIGSALQILKPNGYLFVSTNASEISSENLEDFIQQQGKALKRKVLKTQPMGQDIDFPGSGTMKESYLAAILAHFK